MAATVADLVAVLDRQGIGRAHVLGYSMGGRVALALALAHPDRVGALVLESASPGLAGAGERAARVAADAALAARIEREGVPAFVDCWEALPLWASQARLSADARAALRAQRLQNTPVGLANSLRGLGTGSQPPLWDRLGDLAAPTLLVAGCDDAKFSDLARRMAEAIPANELLLVHSAGHAVHLEQPAVFARLVRDFLLQHDDRIEIEQEEGDEPWH
jgi:2-succinyl-6-hydroxy-2,4-cyclohexadiene-1-carboxylate synthase